MLNNVILVGRLVNDVEMKETESGGKVGIITIAISRTYKNSEGIYETDFVDVELWNLVATNTAEYCNKGDLLGVKGRLETYNIEIDDTKIRKTKVVADKITFLRSKKESEE